MIDPTPEPDKRSTLEDALIEAGKLLGLEIAQLKAALARKDEALRKASALSFGFDHEDCKLYNAEDMKINLVQIARICQEALSDGK